MKQKSTRTSTWIALAAGLGAAGYALAKRRRIHLAEEWETRQKERPSQTALVTGASSGIGRAYSHRLAGLGYNLVLVARREQRLAELAEECRLKFGVETEVLPADLTTEVGVARVEQRIVQGGGIDFLVNNAGFAILGDFVDTPIEDHLAMIQCHNLAAVRFCRAALPGMIERGHGAIVNVSSLGAFVPKPKDVTYNAAKAFLNTFTEALAMEMVGAQVRVQSLAPGLTLTEMHDAPQYAQYNLKERVPGWLWMTAEDVVRASLLALRENRVVCIPGRKNQVIAAAGKSGLTSALLGSFGKYFTQRAVPLQSASLDLLACPECHSQLVLKEHSTEPLVSGTLTCTSCDKSYPMEGGIPRFAPYETLAGKNLGFARLYDWFSWIYRPFSKIGFAFLGGTEEKFRRQILDQLEPHGGRLLEVSIGPGVNLPFLVGQPGVGEIYGLDISVGQLTRCRSYLQKKGWKVDLFQGNAEALPFKDGMFENVLHVGGINFFNDKKKAIAEMIRVTQTGGRIVIAYETERGARGYEFTIPGFKRQFENSRQVVQPPVDLVPPEMEDLRVDSTLWNGWFYCIDFRKPKG